MALARQSPGIVFISQNVFIKKFCKSQFPHKSSTFFYYARALEAFAKRQFTPPDSSLPTQEATQGKIDGHFSQLLYKFYLEEVVFVGDSLKI